MNKKVNTLLFILAATLFNIIVSILSFLAFLLLYSRLIAPLLQGSGQEWSFVLILLAAIAASIFVYRIVLKFLLKKVDVEKYFDPLFVKRNLRKN
jgi:hypothetical protein